MTHQILFALVCSTSLLAACGSNDKPVSSASTSSGSDAAIVDDASYEAVGNDFIGKTTTVLDADGKDCDKLATDLSKLFDDRKSTISALLAYGEAHPEIKKAVMAKHKAESDAFDARVNAAFAACGENEALAAAFAKLNGPVRAKAEPAEKAAR